MLIKNTSQFTLIVNDPSYLTTHHNHCNHLKQRPHLNPCHANQANQAIYSPPSSTLLYNNKPDPDPNPNPNPNPNNNNPRPTRR
eukprot:CAMPEP_0197566862 /NCGR_PEP_ID=MMETSP1320-20131121/34641_1 /TAXON_ID=91990 /ORGANISM="Bolidomonas sp., Strain RCC2347" /LENGTH=83 /DNA_ID=CAMNT_0043128995 /DNA_START=33 /DNA_END=280 /DNA_ORIENTATION=-